MYAQLWKTRLTNFASGWALFGLIAWVVILAFLGASTPLQVLGFVLLTFLIPTLFIGDNKQYRALGLTRKQGFISELMILIPLAVIGTWLFLVDATTLARVICGGLILAALPAHYWGITDRKADEKVQRFFTSSANVGKRNTGTGWLAEPVAQQFYIPAAKAAVPVAVVLVVAVLMGSFAGVEDSGFSLSYFLVFLALYCAAITTPGMIQASGGAGAWHAFGLPRKQYLTYGMLAAFLASALPTAVAILVCAVVDMNALTQSAPKLIYAWITWTVMSVAFVAIQARFENLGNFLTIFFMIFYISGFTDIPPADAHTRLATLTAVICLIIAAIGLACARSVATGKNGTRLTVAASSLSKARA